MLDSLIRTFVPVVVGVLLGQAARIGLDLPEGAVTEVVTVAVTTAYYWVARALERRWPAVGRWLLGAGVKVGQPRYVVPRR
jgi:hypothetical protein